ncbi:hypothetical protein ACH5RR_029442 [Cinchona calisaya]|uniref:Uncharacterized protein n=1 Tax=Cinchona calisaya TaxID=153742 RepID=A0ABD2YTY9_9GENT
MAVLAPRIIDKYPSLMLAKPDISRRPWDAIVRREDNLIRGQKYFVNPQRMKPWDVGRRLVSLKGEFGEGFRGEIRGVETNDWIALRLALLRGEFGGGFRGEIEGVEIGVGISAWIKLTLVGD